MFYFSYSMHKRSCHFVTFCIVHIFKALWSLIYILFSQYVTRNPHLSPRHRYYTMQTTTLIVFLLSVHAALLRNRFYCIGKSTVVEGHKIYADTLVASNVIIILVPHYFMRVITAQLKLSAYYLQ